MMADDGRIKRSFCKTTPHVIVQKMPQRLVSQSEEMRGHWALGKIRLSICSIIPLMSCTILISTLVESLQKSDMFLAQCLKNTESFEAKE